MSLKIGYSNRRILQKKYIQDIKAKEEVLVKGFV